MTGPRIQISKIERERLRPVARPVDAFAPAGSNRAQRLADALAPLSPELSRFGNILAVRQNERALKDGQRFARDLAAEGKTYAQAIKDGRITADQSPWFRVGAEEQLGRISADRFNAALQTEVVSGNLRSSTDPEDFEAFVGKFRSDWLESNVGQMSRSFEQGFGPRAEAHIQNNRSAFASQAGGRLIERVKEQTYQEARSDIRNEMLQGFDPSASLQAMGKRVMATGLSGRETANILTQAVIDEAFARDDLNLLQVLDRIKGPGGSIGQRSETIQAVRRAEEAIIRNRYSERTRLWQELAHERSEAGRQAQVDLVNQFVSGNPINIEEHIAKAPDSAADLIQLSTTLQEGRFGSDRGVVQNLLARINLFEDSGHPDAVDTLDLVGALARQEIDQQDFVFLQNQMQERDRLRRELSDQGDPYKHPQFKEAQRQLDDFFGRTILGTFLDPVQAERARVASARLTEAWLHYRASEEGRTATQRDINKWFFDSVEEIGTSLQDPNQRNTVERRQGEIGTFDPIVDFTQSPVVTLEQFQRISTAISSGVSLDDLPDDVLDLLIQAGVRSPEDLSLFLQKQGALLLTTSSPSSGSNE